MLRECILTCKLVISYFLKRKKGVLREPSGLQVAAGQGMRASLVPVVPPAGINSL